MATQVFISWSGELSRKLAEAVREWLPATLQFVKPYFAPVDIEKGTRWVSEISAELGKSHVGVICLTRDNLSSPWILFEAGALSKNLDRSRVCTLLFGLEPAEVTGPLAVFQATRFTEEDFKGLVETINNADADSKLDKSVLENVFEMWWPRLKEQADKILAEHTPAETGEPRKERDILEEILELTRLHVRQGKPRGFYTRQYTKYMDAFKEGMPLVLYDPELSGNVVVKWLPPVPEVPGDVSPSGSPEPDYSGPDLGNQED